MLILELTSKDIFKGYIMLNYSEITAEELQQLEEAQCLELQNKNKGAIDAFLKDAPSGEVHLSFNTEGTLVVEDCWVGERIDLVANFIPEYDGDEIPF